MAETSAASLEITKVAVLGAGQFGFAIAQLIAVNNKIPVVLYDPVREYIESIQKSRTHPVFHQGVTLPENVTATNSLAESVDGAVLIVLAVPGQFIRGSVHDWAPLVKNDVIVLNLAKALEKGTNKFLHEVVHEEWDKADTHGHKMYFAALAGGMLAEEVSKGIPIAADIACEEGEVSKKLQTLFQTPLFKIRPTTDVTGVELAGAFKNVMAIGAGIFDGLGYAISSKAAYVSMCCEEFVGLAVLLGAQEQTYGAGGHAWMGDVITTCFGPGRNRLFGEYIGSGLSIDDALKKLTEAKKISEGYLTTKAFYNLVNEKGIPCPFLKNVYQLLFEDKPPAEVAKDFFCPEFRGHKPPTK